MKMKCRCGKESGDKRYCSGECYAFAKDEEYFEMAYGRYGEE